MGQVSQSAQWAVSTCNRHHPFLLTFAQPFNNGYIWENTTNNMYIPDPSISYLNTFIGSATQQATSVVTQTNQNCYEGATGCYSIYGFEYKPGFDGAVCPHTAWRKNPS